MDQLPIEIIENIFVNNNLSISDVLNTSETCRQLHYMINNSRPIWKSIFERMSATCFTFDWCSLAPVIQEDVDWLGETKHIYEVKLKVEKLLLAMSQKYHSVYDLGPSELVEWKQFLTSEKIITYHIVVEYLMKLMGDYKEIHSFKVVPLFTPGNNTLRYYCIKVLTFLRHHKLVLEYKEYEQLDEQERTLERTAAFVARWCQPHINLDYLHIQFKLDELALQASELLRVRNPKHPLFEMRKDTLLRWRMRNLDEHHFDGPQCMEILAAVNETLYRQHNFTENRTDYYDVHNSYIDYVLKREIGLPITLCVVYESIARRLGVNCEPVNIPHHFLLRFQRNDLGTDGANMVYYLNASNGGRLFPRGSCPHAGAGSDAQTALMPRATAKSVMLRMTANLENACRESPSTVSNFTPMRSILELSLLVEPNNLTSVLNLARVCMTMNMDTQYIVEILKQNTFREEDNPGNVLQMLNNYTAHRENERFEEKSQPRHRPCNMQYAVGMVIRHKVHDYVGVILDWTPVCSASSTWQQTMNVERLQRKGDQPFYDVMADDGTIRYVAEENIVLCSEPGTLIRMHELGRHFSHFHANHFVPNSEKEAEFPHDSLVRKTAYNLPDS